MFYLGAAVYSWFGRFMASVYGSGEYGDDVYNGSNAVEITATSTTNGQSRWGWVIFFGLLIIIAIIITIILIIRRRSHHTPPTPPATPLTPTSSNPPTTFFPGTPMLSHMDLSPEPVPVFEEVEELISDLLPPEQDIINEESMD